MDHINKKMGMNRKKMLLETMRDFVTVNRSMPLSPLALTSTDQKRLQTRSFLTNAKFFSIIHNHIMNYANHASDLYYSYILEEDTQMTSSFPMALEEEKEKIMGTEFYQTCKEIKNISSNDIALIKALQEAMEKTQKREFPSEKKSEKNFLELLPLIEKTSDLEDAWEDSGIMQDLKLYAILQDYILHIRNTEEFYAFRDTIKDSVNANKEIRNELIEILISGNEKLETIYDWTKFQRIIGKTERNWIRETDQMKKVLSEDVIHYFTIDKVSTIIESIQNKQPIDQESFFEGQKDISPYFHSFESLHHFFATISNARAEQDFPIDILYYYLLCLNITGKDLIQSASQYEKSMQTNLSILKMLSEGENSLYAQRVLEILNKMLGCCEPEAIPSHVDAFARSCRFGGAIPQENDQDAYGIIKGLPCQMVLKKP